jgi:NAD(P)-dependent dehydrogenase (short-subunit alcohol dehydrogenase family)
MENLLAARLALVTGAAQGNGAAIAKGLARHGARVVCTDLAPPEATAAAIRAAGGEAWAMALDVTDGAACTALATRVGREIGAVSLLVNNAGICPRHTVDAPDLLAQFDAAQDVNLRGALRMTQALLAALRETQGTVVNIASIAAFVSTASSLSYTTSKAGLRMLTQGLARELAADGVRVNALAPGVIETPMTQGLQDDPSKGTIFLARTPMGRFGQPEELVGPVVFLSSALSSYVTGATLPVDGGYLAV